MMDDFLAGIQDALDEAADNEQHVKVKVPTVPGLTLNVDGDYMAYYASGNDDCEEWLARKNVSDLVQAAVDATGADTVIMHNTHSMSHKGERFVVAQQQPYQAQRKSERKPKNYAFLRRYLIEYEGPLFRSKTWETREADDGIGYLAHHALTTPVGYAAIFTRDKDMQMLPGLHVDWITKQTVRVMPGEFCVDKRFGTKDRVYGMKFFWLQMLMGDTADHIPGLPGYASTKEVKEKQADGTIKKVPLTTFKPLGEKTAAAFLEGVTTNDEALEVVRGLYQGYWDLNGQNWADRFCEQAALLWMRTDHSASVTDFARHMGCSRINARFCDELNAAVERLHTRVTETREQADALAD